MSPNILHLNPLDKPLGRPGAYSMTLMVEVTEDEHPHGGYAAYRNGPIPGWLTLRAPGLEGQGMKGIESIDLVADFNQQEGAPLRVMLGKQWTHWIAGPEGLDKTKVKKLLPGMSIDFHSQRMVWRDPTKRAIELVVIARRDPGNRSTSISLPRFAIRKLLDIEHGLEKDGEEARWLLEFSPPAGRGIYLNRGLGNHRGLLGVFGDPISCRFDRRRSTLKPIVEPRGRSWAVWDDPSEYNLESLHAKMRMEIVRKR